VRLVPTSTARKYDNAVIPSSPKNLTVIHPPEYVYHRGRTFVRATAVRSTGVRESVAFLRIQQRRGMRPGLIHERRRCRHIGTHVA
jgi:hypothetical protein